MKNITTEPLWNPKRPLIFQKALFFLFNVPGFQLLVFSRGYSILSFPWSLRFGHTRGELLAVEEESEAVEGNLQNRPSVDASEIPRKKTPFTLDVFKKPVVLSGGITNILTGERPITEPSTVPMLGSMIASQDFSLSSLPVFPIRHLGSIWGRGCWGAT